MKIKEEPGSPIEDRKHRKHRYQHEKIKDDPDIPQKKRKHSRTRENSNDSEKRTQTHEKYIRKRHRYSRSHSNSPSRKSSHRKVKRERSLSDGEIAEPVASRWGTASVDEPIYRNDTEFSHDRQNNNNKPEKPKEKPNLGLSGALAKETNMFRGVLINYSEPPEAKPPKKRWRFYPFKGTEEFKPLYLHRQSAYLIGRDRHICDLPLLHPSISKQHAVLQYRSVPYTKPDGSQSRAIRPYIIDLNSPNGTFLNGVQIEPQRYFELKEKDVVKFAFSSRDYVLLHEKSKDDEDDE